MMGAEQGKFSRLLDRDDLWGLLVRITLNKAIDLYRKERRQPRMVEWEIERIISQEPTPEVAAQVTEEYQELLNSLGDETLRAIALWKVEGHTNEEIAAKLDCATRSVERKLRRIRSIWKNRSESPGA
jgi:DNA-directed RNA polymerase specialized sigma24 family protein